MPDTPDPAAIARRLTREQAAIACSLLRSAAVAAEAAANRRELRALHGSLKAHAAATRAAIEVLEAEARDG